MTAPKTPRKKGQQKPKHDCHSDRDGDCTWSGCPQLRDGEPMKSGRSCPLYDWSHDDEM